MSRLLPLILLLPLLPLSAADWQRSWFYDEADSTFNIADLACPAPQFCLAVGMVEELRGGAHPFSVLTRDGGQHWTTGKLPDPPVSLFFLNPAEGWMVTAKSLLHTADAGRTWEKKRSGKGWLRLFFADPQHGWLVGYRGTFERTSDGGQHWVEVASVATFKGVEGETTFEYVHFTDALHGTVVGEQTSGEPAVPDWMDPGMRASLPAPGSGVFAGQTLDGGSTWTWSSAGLHRTLLTAAFPAADHGWLVFGPSTLKDNFSEVTARNWSAWKSTTLVHLDNTRIVDVEKNGSGKVALAAIQVPGKLIETPVPGKVRLFAGDDLSDLHEETVDYRAVARTVTLASTPAAWFAATDTGMILRRTN